MLVSIALVFGAIYYFYGSRVSVSVETPKIEWQTGTDIAATIGTNKTWCQIGIANLEPNATTVYTSALKFKVNSASATSGMMLQITSLTDSNAIIWGIRFYIFAAGPSSSYLALVDGANATVDGTDGNAPLAEVGYRQSTAPPGYGPTSTPTQSDSFTGSAGATYIIAAEAFGKDGILTTYTATMELRLVWS